MTRCPEIKDQDHVVNELKALLEAQAATQARASEELLSRIEASRESTGGLEKGPVGGDWPSYSTGADTGERAGSSSSHRGGVIVESLLRAVGEVQIARGGSLA